MRSTYYQLIKAEKKITNNTFKAVPLIFFQEIDYSFIEWVTETSNTVPFEYLLSFSLTLYVLSLLGIIFNNQKNIIVIMLFIELMLYSLSFFSIACSLMWGLPQGQILALLIMVIAVAESAIGLGILIALFRVGQRVELATISVLRG